MNLFGVSLPKEFNRTDEESIPDLPTPVARDGRQVTFSVCVSIMNLSKRIFFFQSPILMLRAICDMFFLPHSVYLFFSWFADVN